MLSDYIKQETKMIITLELTELDAEVFSEFLKRMGLRSCLVKV